MNFTLLEPLLNYNSRIKKYIVFCFYVFFLNNGFSQCSVGESEVTFDVTKEQWGYEGYWELGIGNRLIVSDYTTGEIVIFDCSWATPIELTRLQTGFRV